MKNKPKFGVMIAVTESPMAKAYKKADKKISKVMREYKKGELHSGSKTGPVVKSRKQAVAIALSEAGKSKTGKKK
jgi:ribosomal protein L21E